MNLPDLPDIGALVQILARLWPQALAKRLESLDVRPGQVAVLRCLLERDGWTQAELCRRVGVEQPTMANTLKRMRRDGLVRMRRDAQDRRKTIVCLAGRGAELNGQLDLAENDLREAALAGLEPTQRRTLARGLEVLVDNLRQDLSENVLVLLNVAPENAAPEDAAPQDVIPQDGAGAVLEAGAARNAPTNEPARESPAAPGAASAIEPTIEPAMEIRDRMEPEAVGAEESGPAQEADPADPVLLLDESIMLDEAAAPDDPAPAEADDPAGPGPRKA